MGYEIYIFISNNPRIPHDLIQKLTADITEMFYTVIQAIIDIELEVYGNHWHVFEVLVFIIFVTFN